MGVLYINLSHLQEGRHGASKNKSRILYVVGDKQQLPAPISYGQMNGSTLPCPVCKWGIVGHQGISHQCFISCDVMVALWETQEMKITLSHVKAIVLL